MLEDDSCGSFTLRPVVRSSSGVQASSEERRPPASKMSVSSSLEEDVPV